MQKLLIQNGRVLDPASNFDRKADVLISDGLIAVVGENLDGTGAIKFDTKGTHSSLANVVQTPEGVAA